VRDSYLETNGHVTDFVINCLSFIGSLSEAKYEIQISSDWFYSNLIPNFSIGVSVKKFTEILKNTELLGVLPVLYSVLLRDDCSANGLGPSELSAAALKVTKAVFKMLTSIAKMDPETFQVR